MRVPSIAAAVLMLAPAALAADAASGPVVETLWAFQVPDRVIAQGYPAAAARAKLTGWVSLTCRADGRGGLKACEITDEQPAGLGLGAYAIRTARKFKPRSASPDAPASESRIVALTIDFTPEDMLRIVEDGAPQHLSGPAPLVRAWWARRVVYPTEARLTYVSGRVLLRCRATDAGRVGNCSVFSEIPQGVGFARAALTRVDSLKIEPKALDGTAVAGRLVEIPVVMNPRGQ